MDDSVIESRGNKRIRGSLGQVTKESMERGEEEEEERGEREERGKGQRRSSTVQSHDSWHEVKGVDSSVHNSQPTRYSRQAWVPTWSLFSPSSSPTPPTFFNGIGCDV